MNKRVNTVLFLVGAVLFILVLMVFYFLAFLGIGSLLLPDQTGFLAQATWVVFFLSALAASWFTYRWLFRILRERIRLERYFDPFLFKDKWF